MRSPSVSFNFAAFPMDIWDQQIPLTEGEFRLIGYLSICAFRSHKQIAVLTDDEMLHGRKRQDGSRRDKGCGLSRNTLKRAREALSKRGWLVFDPDALTYQLTYGMEVTSDLSDDPWEDTNETVPKPTECQSLTPQVSDLDTCSLLHEEAPKKSHDHVLSDFGFDEFCSIYPKRQGNLGKPQAREKWKQLLKNGVRPEEIIEGVKRYRQSMEESENVGTPFVAMMTTWLNQKRWEDEYGPPLHTSLKRSGSQSDGLSFDRIQSDTDARLRRMFPERYASE